MKDKMSNDKDNDKDKMLRDMFSSLKALPEYNLNLESKIMDRIDVELDHPMILAKYKKWSRFGFITSISLVLILLIFSFITITDTASLDSKSLGLQHFTPSFFALIGLVLIFVQIEIKKQVNSKAELQGQ